MICNKCGLYFSNIVVIDNKKRNLHSRKYCLECSPFGKHNTQKLDGTPSKRSENESKQKNITFEVDENGCHICTSHATFGGGRYYQIQRDKKKTSVHRFIWEQANGKIEDKSIVVRHKCDNDSCINLDHLELGTQKDNMQDCKNRGRIAKGNKSGNLKIPDSEIDNIIKLYAEGKTQANIAKMYNVDQSNISLIVNKKTRKS